MGEYESSNDGGYVYDVTYQKHNKQVHHQEIFVDCEDNVDMRTWRRDNVVSLRRCPNEEIKALIVVVMEQAKSNYNLRNRVVNQDQGKPAGIFIKESGPKNFDGKKSKNKEAQKVALVRPNHNMPKNQETQKKDTPQIEAPKTSTSHIATFDITNTLSKKKVLVPLLEKIMILEYKNNTLTLISKFPYNLNENKKSKGNRMIDTKEKGKWEPKRYLGTVIPNDPSQVDPFYLMLLINNKLMKNCMIHFGPAINVMPLVIMKELVLQVDDHFGRCYAMDNMFVPIAGVMKDVEIKIASNLEATY